MSRETSSACWGLGEGCERNRKGGKSEGLSKRDRITPSWAKKGRVGRAGEEGQALGVGCLLGANCPVGVRVGIQ